MNFSKLSKILCLILAFTLAVGLLSGCSKNEPEPENTLPGLDLGGTSESTDPSTETTVAPETETTEAPNENMGTVTSGINLRSTPSMDATVVQTLSAGDRIEIIRQETVAGFTWGLITEPAYGWVVMDYVEMDVPTSGGNDTSTPAGNGDATTPTQPETESSGETVNIKGVVTGNGVNVRDEPSTTTGKVVGSYNKGDSVTILETQNGWGRTTKGWIKMDYVNTSGTTTPPATEPTTGNNNTTGNNSTGNVNSGNGNTTVIAKGIVVAKELNIRASAGTDSNRVGGLVFGDRVNILEKSGSWGRIKNGWISLNYVYQDGTKGTNTANGIITASELRIRSGPGTGYEVVGSYDEGDVVSILEQFTYGNTTWGCTNKGWISMEYVDTEGESNDGSSGSNEVVDTDGNTYTVTAENGLWVRSGAGTNYPTVSSLKYGDRVTITEKQTVNGVTWGRMEDGWVSMAFLSSTTNSNEEVFF